MSAAIIVNANIHKTVDNVAATSRIAAARETAYSAGCRHFPLDPSQKIHTLEIFMKRIRLAVLAALTLAFTGALQANEELATKSGCMACHKVDAKVLGPGLKEVAAKYKGDKKAEAMLIEKVKKGGMGTWGPIPMPPNGHIKDEDIKMLVKWVLALK